MDLQFGEPNRRRFLGRAAASTAIIVAHGCMASPNDEPASESEEGKGMGPRIRSLELITAAPLAKMKEFYHEALGLRVLAEKSDRLTIGAGETPLTFVAAGADAGKPFYHFAFNIPENKIVAARDWQKERSPLLPIPARLRDPKYPDDIVDYRHWNAHSVFFFDPAENVVEYIARHDLKNGAAGAFSSKDILYGSEIGLIVDDVPSTAAKLKEVVGIGQYKGGSDEFTALGDEQGLLLVMKRGRVLSFDSEVKKAADTFRTTASVRGAKQAKYRFPKLPYEVFVEG